MKLHITHKTDYAYSEPVGYALQKVRLRPLSSSLQNVLDWTVSVTGGIIETGYSDHFLNHVDLCSLEQGGQSMSISVSGTVETLPTTGVMGQTKGAAPLWLFLQQTPTTLAGAGVKPLSDIVSQSSNVLDGLHALSNAVLAAVPYAIGATGADTTVEEALEIGSGVCQDHAQIFVSAARQAGVPARYVSGYLMMNETVDQDASHAWAEAYVDGLGWVGFDVSNGYSPDERYVRIAIGRDATEASPVKGLRLGNAEESLIVSLQVQQ